MHVLLARHSPPARRHRPVPALLGLRSASRVQPKSRSHHCPTESGRRSASATTVPSIRTSPARGRPRPPNRPGMARPPRREHHDDLHPRPQPRSGRRPQAGRPDVPVVLDVPDGPACAAAPAISRKPSRCIPTLRALTAPQPRRICGVASAHTASASWISRTASSRIVVQDRSR